MPVKVVGPDSVLEKIQCLQLLCLIHTVPHTVACFGPVST